MISTSAVANCGKEWGGGGAETERERDKVARERARLRESENEIEILKSLGSPLMLNWMPLMSSCKKRTEALTFSAVLTDGDRCWF